MTKRYEQAIPFGWYFVDFVQGLKQGEVKALKYFGKELVLFRTESGEAKLLDAYCPHLGAHLGYGGKVHGESIACPFHGWQFNGAGQCTAVPYAKNMPPKVAGGKQAIYAYPVVERNGVIWAWYHPQQVAPLFDVLEFPEFTAADWTPIDMAECPMWTMNTIIQETAENGVDAAHFIYVHNSVKMPESDTEWKDHMRITKAVTTGPKMQDDGTLDRTPGVTGTTNLTSMSIGPGQTSNRFTGAVETLLMGLATPIDDQNLELRFIFTQPKDLSIGKRMMAEGVKRNLVEQVQNDIPIWENKKYMDPPVLCDSDGPIHQYRKWFQQFYASADAPVPLRMAQ
jgi:phenylpropionate dioxygenase-like ring-hydroxylating dioxygenase large terminal subunit